MSTHTAALDVDVELPYDALVSYHYFRSDQTMTELTDHGRLRLIADSGAFSAYTQGVRIDLDEYAAWLKTWSPRLYWAAALDVFGDPDTTYRNWATLRDTHGLTTVPTIHIGADPRHLDVYADQGVDFVGLGGMVGMPKPNITRWLVHVMRYARDHHPQMRFHAWGMSTQTLLEELPLYSVDSSGLLTQAYRYGTLALFNPRSRRMVSIDLNGRDPLKYRRLLLDTYGIPPREVATSHPGNRHLLARLCARSSQLRAQYLQRLHKVTPPSWGINPHWNTHTRTSDHPVGPLMHAVSTRNNDLNDATTGPRLHLLDGMEGNTKLTHPATPEPEPGPRMHVVANTTNLRRLHTPREEGDPLK